MSAPIPKWDLDVKFDIYMQLINMLKRIPTYPHGDGCSDEIAGWIIRAIERIEHDDNGRYICNC